MEQTIETKCLKARPVCSGKVEPKKKGYDIAPILRKTFSLMPLADLLRWKESFETSDCKDEPAMKCIIEDINKEICKRDFTNKS